MHDRAKDAFVDFARADRLKAWFRLHCRRDVAAFRDHASELFERLLVEAPNLRGLTWDVKDADLEKSFCERYLSDPRCPLLGLAVHSDWSNVETAEAFSGLVRRSDLPWVASLRWFSVGVRNGSYPERSPALERTLESLRHFPVLEILVLRNLHVRVVPADLLRDCLGACSSTLKRVALNVDCALVHAPFNEYHADYFRTLARIPNLGTIAIGGFRNGNSTIARWWSPPPELPPSTPVRLEWLHLKSDSDESGDPDWLTSELLTIRVLYANFDRLRAVAQSRSENPNSNGCVEGRPFLKTVRTLLLCPPDNRSSAQTTVDFPTGLEACVKLQKYCVLPGVSTTEAFAGFSGATRETGVFSRLTVVGLPYCPTLLAALDAADAYPPNLRHLQVAIHDVLEDRAPSDQAWVPTEKWTSTIRGDRGRRIERLSVVSNVVWDRENSAFLVAVLADRGVNSLKITYSLGGPPAPGRASEHSEEPFFRAIGRSESLSRLSLRLIGSVPVVTHAFDQVGRSAVFKLSLTLSQFGGFCESALRAMAPFSEVKHLRIATWKRGGVPCTNVPTVECVERFLARHPKIQRLIVNSNDLFRLPHRPDLRRTLASAAAVQIPTRDLGPIHERAAQLADDPFFAGRLRQFFDRDERSCWLSG